MNEMLHHAHDLILDPSFQKHYFSISQNPSFTLGGIIGTISNWNGGFFVSFIRTKVNWRLIPTSVRFQVLSLNVNDRKTSNLIDVRGIKNPK